LNFSNDPPQPVGQFSDAGTSNAVARGDHTHAMPDIWGTSVASGVVVFDMDKLDQTRQIESVVIDPELGGGAIYVVLGLESNTSGEGVFVGQIDQFEDQHFPEVILAANIFPAAVSPDSKEGLVGNSTFQIWAHATMRGEVLPQFFRVHWWAYRAGKNFGEMPFNAQVR
jgi:hypothetical protein